MKHEITPVQIGREIRAHRITKSLNVTKLAQLSGVSIGNLSRIESGLNANTGVFTLIKIADALEVSIADILLPGINSPENKDDSIDNSWVRKLDLLNMKLKLSKELVKFLISQR